MNKNVQKAIVEIIFFIAGMLAPRIDIFGKRDVDELNNKLVELLKAIQE